MKRAICIVLVAVTVGLVGCSKHEVKPVTKSAAAAEKEKSYAENQKDMRNAAAKY